MTTPPFFEVAETSRDEQALDALRERVLAIDGLWQLFVHNRSAAGLPDLPGADVGYIAETPLGGPTQQYEIGQGSDAAPVVREFTRQWQLLLHAPVGSGLDHIKQSAAIESALRALPITFGDDDARGPFTIRLLDINTGSPRPATRAQSHVTVPVVVLYQFLAPS